MKILNLAAAAVAALALPAFAAIAPGTSQSGANAPYSGNGELFLSVFDAGPKISYTLDLGVTQNDFFASGQAVAGASRSWAVNDATWLSFLTQVTRANLQWAVLAVDQTGGTAVGGVRLFTTLAQGQEAEFANLTNQKFTNAMGGAQAGTFFNAVNVTGTHGVAGQALSFATNGSSVNKDSDPGNSYFGEGSVGLGSNLNGNASFSVANPVGTSSFFYYLTRSGANQLDAVQVDPFDNAAGKGVFSLDAGAGNALTLSYLLAPVPEPGTFAMLLAGIAAVVGMARRRVG